MSFSTYVVPDHGFDAAAYLPVDGIAPDTFAQLMEKAHRGVARENVTVGRYEVDGGLSVRMDGHRIGIIEPADAQKYTELQWIMDAGLAPSLTMQLQLDEDGMPAAHIILPPPGLCVPANNPPDVRWAMVEGTTPIIINSMPLSLSNYPQKSLHFLATLKAKRYLGHYSVSVFVDDTYVGSIPRESARALSEIVTDYELSSLTSVVRAFYEYNSGRPQLTIYADIQHKAQHTFTIAAGTATGTSLVLTAASAARADAAVPTRGFFTQQGVFSSPATAASAGSSTTLGSTAAGTIAPTTTGSTVAGTAGSLNPIGTGVLSTAASTGVGTAAGSAAGTAAVVTSGSIAGLQAFTAVSTAVLVIGGAGLAVHNLSNPMGVKINADSISAETLVKIPESEIAASTAGMPQSPEETLTRSSDTDPQISARITDPTFFERANTGFSVDSQRLAAGVTGLSTTGSAAGNSMGATNGVPNGATSGASASANAPLQAPPAPAIASIDDGRANAEGEVSNSKSLPDSPGVIDQLNNSRPGTRPNSGTASTPVEPAATPSASAVSGPEISTSAQISPTYSKGSPTADIPVLAQPPAPTASTHVAPHSTATNPTQTSTSEETPSSTETIPRQSYAAVTTVEDSTTPASGPTTPTSAATPPTPVGQSRDANPVTIAPPTAEPTPISETITPTLVNPPEPTPTEVVTPTEVGVEPAPTVTDLPEVSTPAEPTPETTMSAEPTPENTTSTEPTPTEQLPVDTSTSTTDPTPAVPTDDFVFYGGLGLNANPAGANKTPVKEPITDVSTPSEAPANETEQPTETAQSTETTDSDAGDITVWKKVFNLLFGLRSGSHDFVH